MVYVYYLRWLLHRSGYGLYLLLALRVGCSVGLRVGFSVVLV